MAAAAGGNIWPRRFNGERRTAAEWRGGANEKHHSHSFGSFDSLWKKRKKSLSETPQSGQLQPAPLIAVGGANSSLTYASDGATERSALTAPSSLHLNATPL